MRSSGVRQPVGAVRGSCALAYPLTQSRPRLTGASGSPFDGHDPAVAVAIWMPQPVPQNRHTPLSHAPPTLRLGSAPEPAGLPAPAVPPRPPSPRRHRRAETRGRLARSCVLLRVPARPRRARPCDRRGAPIHAWHPAMASGSRARLERRRFERHDQLAAAGSPTCVSTPAWCASRPPTARAPGCTATSRPAMWTVSRRFASADCELGHRRP